MKKIFFLLLLSLFLVSSVHAVTVLNSKIDTTMKAGDQLSFDMILSPDAGEDRIVFERIAITGDCSEWVIVNKTSMDFTTSTPVNAAISVPKNAVNGVHRCEITYIAPANGMIQIAIAVPIKINVTGGIDPTPTPITTVTTVKPTTAIPSTTAIPEPKPTYTPIQISIIISGVIGAAIIVIMEKRRK